MRTSVIVPCFRAEATVTRAIGSVLDQTDTDFELIAVDDGSPDKTLEVLRGIADPRLRIIEHGNNRGISAARNTGLATATGEFLAFLDADDCWDSRFLTRMHSARGDGDAAVCGRTVVRPDGSERNARSARLGAFSGDVAAMAMMSGALTPFPWDKLVRRSAFAGLEYPADIHRFEDLAVGIVALSRVDRVVSIPDPLVRYHIAAESLTWGRVPDVTEADSAFRFLERELDGWASTSARRSALETCHTMLLMLTAQSAMRAPAGAAASAALSQSRRRISASMIASTVRNSPVFGAGALLLKTAPWLYSTLLRGYLKRQYALS